MDKHSLPIFVTQYFWGDDLSQLDITKNKVYIIQVLLERGNQKALHWLLSIFDRDTIKNLLPNIKLSKKSSNFWNLYLN